MPRKLNIHQNNYARYKIANSCFILRNKGTPFQLLKFQIMCSQFTLTEYFVIELVLAGFKTAIIVTYYNIYNRVTILQAIFLITYKTTYVRYKDK